MWHRVLVRFVGRFLIPSGPVPDLWRVFGIRVCIILLTVP